MVRPRWPFLTVLTLTLILTLPALPLHADADWPVPRGPSHEPSPVRYDAKQWQTVPKEFLDDAAACVLYAGNNFLIEADGTVETITHEITRLNGRKGIEKLGEYRNLTYDPSYQKLTLNEARVHKADGRLVQIEPRHVQLRDISTDYQVYDHEKQLIISFPSLEVGDVIEIKWTVRGKNPEHAGRFFNRYSFGDLTYPVVLDELCIRVPKDKPFKYASVGPAPQEGTITEGKFEPVKSPDGDGIVYHWKAGNCKRPPQDDNLPPKEELRPAVACSTFASWEEVGRWKQRLRADCWQCNEDLRKVVKEVTRGLNEPAAKARALTYWLRRNIRYVSSGEKHDYTPHAPSMVLANRYGDCKDTSQMLAVMLREAGIRVELATLGVVDDGQVLENVPSPWGTHAILLATIDGQSHWIDTTASLAGWDFLPRDDRNRQCYLVDDQGKIRLQRTPPAVPEGNRYEQTTTIWIGADGSSRSDRTVIAHGSAALGQRDTFLEVPSGERRRQVTSELQDSNSQARLVQLTIDEAALRDFDAPTKVRMVFEIPNHFPGSTEREGSITDSKLWSRLLAYNIDYDRQVALNLFAPFESSHRYIIHIHPAYSLETVPRDKSVRSAWGTFTRRVKEAPEGEGKKLEVEFYTRLDKSRVEPADFDRFRQFQDDVNKGYRAWLNLKPVQDLSEAPLLEGMLPLAPGDSASAAALARLYQDNRRSADARRVLERARFYRPEEAILWELSVKSSANPAEEEKIQRELVKRFPDEIRYVLALADVLIQRHQQSEARKLLQPLTKKGTAAQRAQALFYLARSHYRTDDLEKALNFLTEAGKVDAETVHSVRAYQLKGQILEELGRPRDAVLAYLEALTVDSQAESSLDALVRLMLADNKPDEALQYLRRYTVAVGDEVSGLLLAAEYYLRLKHYDEAFELASRAREQKFHEKAQRILGLVYLERGDLARAVEHLDKATPDATVLDALIRADLRLGNLKDTAARLEQADRLDKPTPELRKTVERAQTLIGRAADLGKELPAPEGKGELWSEALGHTVCAEEAYREGAAGVAETLLRKALEKGLTIGPALALRGRLALERGKLNRALEDAEQAIQSSPKQPLGYYVRGRVRQERLQPEALTDLEKAAELSQHKDADILHSLAAALAQAGKVMEALTIQRQAVKIKPHDRELAEQLDTLEKRIRSSRPAP